MRRVLGYVRKAAEEYKMINEGDNIAVGISGGKDSLVLLYALHLYRYFSPVKYNITAITISMGFNEQSFSLIKKFIKSLNIDYIIKETQLAKIIFEERCEKNPCSLCSKMRKGILNDIALEHGCTKVALGHHRDDLIETFFLSLFYESRFHAFTPVHFLDRKEVTLIRPLVYCPEKEIINAAQENQIPVISNPCPANGITKRDTVGKMITEIEKSVPEIRDRLLTAMKKGCNIDLTNIK